MSRIAGGSRRRIWSGKALILSSPSIPYLDVAKVANIELVDQFPYFWREVKELGELSLVVHPHQLSNEFSFGRGSVECHTYKRRSDDQQRIRKQRICRISYHDLQGTSQAHTPSRHHIR